MNVMKQKAAIVLVLIIIILSAAGCGRRKVNTEETLDYLKNLDSYSTDIVMQISNDKQEIKYTGKQIYCRKFGYRFEINGERVLLYIGDKIYVKDIVGKTDYITDKSFDDFYKLSFIGEYINLLYTDEKIKCSIKKVEKNEYQVIDLCIPGANRNMCRAELYISLPDLKPKKLIIYDNKNKATANIEYENFIPNPDIDEELFKTDGMES